MDQGKRWTVLKRDGFRCRYCGATAAATQLQVDHVHPRSRGGGDDLENLVTACVDCNQGKRASLLDGESGVSGIDGLIAEAIVVAEFHGTGLSRNDLVDAALVMQHFGGPGPYAAALRLARSNGAEFQTDAQRSMNRWALRMLRTRTKRRTREIRRLRRDLKV